MSPSPERASARFERFVERSHAQCLEHSIKLDAEQCHDHRLNAWFSYDHETRVLEALTLFETFAAQMGVDFDVPWARSVVDGLDLTLAKSVVVGTDFRRNARRSRLKLAFSFVGAPSAVSYARGLAPIGPALEAALAERRLTFGLAIDGAGRRHVKLYPSFHIDGDDVARFDRFATQHLSSRAIAYAHRCMRVFVTEGAPHEGAPLVLHFRPRELDAFIRDEAFTGLPIAQELERQRSLGRRPLVISAPHGDLAAGRVRTTNLYAFESAPSAG